MDFGLDETQQEVARLAADVLGRESDTPWKALGEAGLLSLAVPERLGGDGLGVLETALLLTEVGRRAADVPALATLALGVLPIVRYGTPEQQDEWLPLVSEQHGVLTAAMSEPSAPLPGVPGTKAFAGRFRGGGVGSEDQRPARRCGATDPRHGDAG